MEILGMQLWMELPTGSPFVSYLVAMVLLPLDFPGLLFLLMWRGILMPSLVPRQNSLLRTMVSNESIMRRAILGSSFEILTSFWRLSATMVA